MSRAIFEFLLARIAEDEAAAERAASHNGGGTFANDNYGCLLVQPERVLHECEAKRRIVEEHPPHPDHRPPRLVARLRLPQQLEVTFCETCGDPYHWDQTAPVEWPCPTLRALALPYAEHPDYREEWRP